MQDKVQIFLDDQQAKLDDAIIKKEKLLQDYKEELVKLIEDKT